MSLARVLFVNLMKVSQQREPEVVVVEKEDEQEGELVQFPLVVLQNDESPRRPEPNLESVELPPGVRRELIFPHEAAGCKALLLEILRRSSYDWVLYRTSSRLQHKVYAEEAYYWLFVEGPDSPGWKERIAEGKYITSFLGVCESTGLDPDKVRAHIRKMTPKNVMSVGRPTEYRRREPVEEQDAYSLNESDSPESDD